MNEQDIIAFIGELARESADFIMPHFANPDLRIETKDDATPVTIADRGAEKLLRERISQKYPGHGFIGEEFGNENEDAEFVWVLDPIDGTRAFTHGCPLFGTLICLMREGQPWIGAIHLPVSRQLIIGNGKQAWMNGRPTLVRDTPRLRDALLLATDLKTPAEYQNGEAWERLVSRAGTVRTWGDCYGYALVAGGGADIMCDPVLSPWDLMALIPVIRGAGGVITDWQGNDAVAGKSCVAAIPALHEQVIEILNP